MTTTFQKFLKKNIDLAPLGIERGTENCAYFCTPIGASMIGWTGVDGIHYCFIRGFGEVVFAVSPENTPGDYVHPVAENFADFLRLLLACGGEAALEQAWAWDQAQFDAFLRDNPITEKQQNMLNVICEKMALAPMNEPFAYIKKIQAEFDYSKIKYTEDFYDPDMNPNAEPKFPEWKVYFEGNFGGHHGLERAGKEIPIGKEFQWGDSRWLIPAAYSCSKGLVVDLCHRVSAEHIRAFMDKWNLSVENDDPRRFSQEQQMQIDAENPLCADVRLEATVNGNLLRASHGCAITWNPCLPESFAQELEACAAVKHYDLDPADGWTISRHSFCWATKRKPEIKSLAVTIKQNRIAIPGPHFRVVTPGDSFQFTHPTTGQAHTLIVHEYEQRELPESRFNHRPEMEFPTHYTAMSYTISPDLPDGALTIQDCVDSDQPRQKKSDPMEPEAVSDACCIGIIGGSNGPTAIAFGQENQGKLRASCSALHFESAEDVEWRIVFHEKQLDDIAVELM